MSHATLIRVLAVAGALLQLVGFAGAVLIVSATRYREYGNAGFLRRVWLNFILWFVYWFEAPPEPIMARPELLGALEMSATLSVRKYPESDVERLDRELRALRSAFERYRDQTATRLTALETQLGQQVEESQRRFEELQGRHDKARQSGLRREARASLLFLVGTLLTILSYAI